jgi:hypothetical protein
MIHLFEPSVWITLFIELLKVTAGAAIFVLSVFGIGYLVVTKIKSKKREEV